MAVLSPQEVYAVARQAGATHQEAVILTAIAKGESGWNTGAHNPKPPDDSYGLWQINMLGSMGTQRAKSWGLSSYSQLFDPRVNARAALSILRSQGWRAWSVYTSGAYKSYLGTAQAAGDNASGNWQTIATSLGKAIDSGRIKVGSTDGDVGTFIGGAGGDGGGGGGATYNPQGGLPPNATPEQIEEYIRSHYPQAAGFLNIPEIRSVLIDAARGEWTPEKLQGALQATKWWRTNAEATRQYWALKATDPAQFKALIEQKVAELKPQMAELGINDGNVVRFIAEGALKYGWTPDQVRKVLGDLLTTQSKEAGLQQGSAPDLTADELMNIARNEYFVPISRQDAERWAIDIYRGAKTEETVRDYFGRLAEARFPGLPDGFTPGEYMAPIRNVIAETLELNPAEVNFLDRRWVPVLEQEGSDGKLRPMTLAEATRWARSRPEYQTTKGALDEAAQMADFIGKSFGTVA